MAVESGETRELEGRITDTGVEDDTCDCDLCGLRDPRDICEMHTCICPEKRDASGGRKERREREERASEAWSAVRVAWEVEWGYTVGCV